MKHRQAVSYYDTLLGRHTPTAAANKRALIDDTMNMDQPDDAMKKMTRALKRQRSLEIIDAAPPPPAILDAPPGEEQEQMEESDPEPEDINDEPGDDEAAITRRALKRSRRGKSPCKMQWTESWGMFCATPLSLP